MITAEKLRASLEATNAETADAFRQVRAIEELRAKVERLNRTSIEGATDEDCEAAARELVKASEDLRIATIIEPRKLAARDAAQARRTEHVVSVLGCIERHFQALKNEANTVARQVMEKLVSPVAMEIRADQNRDGVLRDQAVAQMVSYTRGGFDAWLLENQAHTAQDFWSRGGAASNADTLIEILDGATARIQTDIATLRKVLAAIGGSEAGDGESTGGVAVSSPSGATVPAEAPDKPARTAKVSAAAETATV